MIRTQVSLDAATYEAAKAKARREGIPLAEFFRRALAAALQTKRGNEGGETPPWMRHAGAVNSGDPDASTSVDAIVYGRRDL